MTVAFKELAGSPKETYAPEGLRAERHILCAWEDRLAMVAALLGDGYALGGTRRAAYPDRPPVVAMRVEVAPFHARPDDQGAFNDVTAQLNSYSGQYAELTIAYELLEVGSRPGEPAHESGTFLAYRMGFSNQEIALPGDAFHWEVQPEVPVTADAIPVLRVPLVEHRLTWYRVSAPPWDAVRACVGCVNTAEFLGAVAGTVLFDGVTADREFIALQSDGRAQYAWRLVYVFRERAARSSPAPGLPLATYGWNYAYRPLPQQSPGFDRPLDGAGNTLYRAVDFAQLFVFGRGMLNDE
jgi:hypothetical protein